MEIKVRAYNANTEQEETLVFTTTSLTERAPKETDLFNVDRLERRWNSAYRLADGERAFFFSPSDGYSYIMTEEEFRYYMNIIRKGRYGKEHADDVLAVLDGTYRKANWWEDWFEFSRGHSGYLTMTENVNGQEWTLFGD